jgi:hypothetical protein
VGAGASSAGPLAGLSVVAIVAAGDRGEFAMCYLW